MADCNLTAKILTLKSFAVIVCVGVDNDTISNYLKYICDSFLFYKASRYDLNCKEYLKTLNKYYVCDLGLRNEKSNFRQVEMTHILENILKEI